MPRPESTMSAGFFPTPPRVTAAIARHLTASAAGGRRTVRLLDPCAGTGDAAMTVARALGAESYGIEINNSRAEAARKQLDHVLASSAFSVRVANGAFSVLFLNPPYADDEEKRRLEHAFVTSMTRVLCVGGALVLVVPQRRLSVSARFLASHYTAVRAYRLPDPECDAFGQIVLFAIRRAGVGLDGSLQAQIEGWGSGGLPPLPDFPADDLLPVPALPGGDVLFATLSFDPAQAASEARQRGVWAQSQLIDQLWPGDERPVRPLMPLRRGHLALLIAAGMLNNVVLHQDGQRLLVKGRTHKVMIPVETDDENVEVEREVLRTSVTVLDLATGALEVIDTGGGVEHQEQQAA